METERRLLNVNQAHRSGYRGHHVGVAILDTGVSPVHDLTTPDNRIRAFVDLVGGKPSAYDDNGHGTHVAGGG